MSAGNRAAHARALLLSGRCPSCAELMGPRALFGANPCPSCEASVRAELGGAQLATHMRERGRRHVLLIALGVGLAHLVLGSFPLLGAGVLVLAAVWIRVGILQPASAVLDARRRVLTRWTARLVVAIALAFTVVATEALTLVPMLGPIAKSIISAAEVAIAAGVVARYVHWQVDREAAGTPIASWEWAALVACMMTLVAALIGVALAFAALASVYEGALEWLQ